MKITLPLPNSKVSPNKSYGKHWSHSYKIKKNNRMEGYLLGVNELKNCNDVFKTTDQLELRLNVYHEDNVHLDDDNLLFALKSYRDGIFDALKKKYNLNDRQITLTLLDTSLRDSINPRVELELKVRN